MNRRHNPITYVLVGMLLLSGPNLHAADRIATQVDLDNAVAKSLNDENTDRKAITTLLQTDEVRNLANGMGVDVRKAENAVGTLQGDELRRAAALAADANSQLAGGTQTVSISLVALLLIIIIVILVA